MIKKIVTNKEQLAIPSVEIHDDVLIKEILQNLKDTAIYHAKTKIGCVGLAANQINYLHRIILINHGGIWVSMVNPVIDRIKGCKSSLAGEGCLSRPGVRKKIRRDKTIIVTWLDEKGEGHQEQIKGFSARVIAHECDHLNGKFI